MRFSKVSFKNLGNQAAVAECPVVRSNIRLDSQPLEFGNAENVLLRLTTDEQSDPGRRGKFFRQVIERCKSNPATNQNFFLSGIARLKPLTEGAENVKMIAVVEGGKHCGPFTHNTVEYFQVRLLDAAGNVREYLQEDEE